MSQVFARIFVLLVIFQYTHQQPNTKLYEEKATVVLNCEPPSKGSLINWFRVREDNIEFLGSVTVNDELKANAYPSLFTINRNMLTLKEFQKARDSGIYSCSSLNKNMLHFGKATRIQGSAEARPTMKTVAAAATAALPRPGTGSCSSPPCSCQIPMDTKSTEIHPSIKCELVIFAPLAGGCGLLFLVLIITICYCHRMRTKRCPHHYKRTPKNLVPVRRATPDRYV
ncbi:hypothetical protein SKAU_G00355370 [Synaphobranchus kaupii]|uniref:Ig-like domain-containing protein n=1 Tax=Synaphobranchus kaupii TaxID=118154 RepID=A0A9Q1EH64_SYNKA|nr:hypothetical protein SKAU_G00355370 [Synaphobranchus kaupii]